MAESPGVVRDALGSLSGARFASVVAALWRARGFTVSRSGSRLRVTKDGPERVLYVIAAGEDEEEIPADVDSVVTATDDVEVPAGVDVIDLDTLTDLFRYAIPDAARSRIGGAYLGFDAAPDHDHGQGPDTVGTAERTDTAVSRVEGRATETDVDDDSDGDRTAETESRSGTRRAVIAGAGAFVAGWGVGAATDIGPFGAGDSAPANDSSSTTPTPVPVVAVPGLARDGVADPERLAQAHTNRIEATSFTISSIQTAHAEDGTLQASLAITTRIGEDRRFRSDIATTGADGRPVFGRFPATAALFSAGDRLYRRLTVDGETTHRSAPLGFGVNGWFYWSSTFPFGSLYYSAEAFYRDVFGTVDVSLSSVRGDGDPPYRLLASSVSPTDPNPQTFALVDAEQGVEAVDLVATVAGAGLVESLQLDYEGLRESGPARAQVTTTYRDLGDTDVERPSWVDRAEPE